MNFFETPRRRICARDVASSRRANRIARRPRASRRVLSVARDANVARRTSRTRTRRGFADSRAHRDTSRHANRRLWGHFPFVFERQCHVGDAREERVKAHHSRVRTLRRGMRRARSDRARNSAAVTPNAPQTVAEYETAKRRDRSSRGERWAQTRGLVERTSREHSRRCKQRLRTREPAAHRDRRHRETSRDTIVVCRGFAANSARAVRIIV